MARNPAVRPDLRPIPWPARSSASPFDDGHLPGGGLIPTLIEWAGAAHPADAMADDHLSVVTMAGSHPEPASIRSALASLGLTETLKITYAVTPRLAAMLRTPRGTVTL